MLNILYAEALKWYNNKNGPMRGRTRRQVFRGKGMERSGMPF